MHRFKSTRFAVLVGAVLMFAIFSYHIVRHDVIRWDLFDPEGFNEMLGEIVEILDR